MIELKPMPGGIHIEYPVGDTFKFTLKAPKRFKEGTKVRFEVSPNGGRALISKEYKPTSNKVDITLTELEAGALSISRNHLYKIFLVSENATSTVVCGTIKIKWGV